MSKYVKVEITKEMEEYHNNWCHEDGCNCEDCPCKIGESDCVFSLNVMEE